MKTNSLFVLFVLFLSACGGGSSVPSPKVFDSTAIKIFMDAKDVLDAFDPKITAGVKSNDLASIAVAADAAMTKIDAQINKIDALIAPPGGEDYKAAVKKCLEMSKAIVETGKKYGELKEGYSKKEFNALEKEYNKKKTQLSNELKNVGKAQEKFLEGTGK
jgi:hypothetical protein